MKTAAKKALSLALTALMTLALLPCTALAGDYESHWAAPYIEKAHERGWMMGDGNGNFWPGDSITRGELSVMLWRALGSPTPQSDCPFTDITADAYYRDAVTALFEMGIGTGVGDGLFGPNVTVTREMAFTMLARAWQLTPVNAAAYKRFTDWTSVSDWGKDALSAMTEKGYVQGDGGKLMPKKALTRGQMAKLLVVVCDGENTPDVMPPAITLTQSPITSTYGNVTVTAMATDASGVAYIGWRSSSSGASYTNKTGFTDITANKTFSVSSNGWYAVCAVDIAGNFSFKLIQISNIQTFSGGGGNTPSGVAVTGVTLDRTEIETNKQVGAYQFQLTADITPANATNKSVTWSSSDSAVQVDNNGHVTIAADTGGVFTVTVTTADGAKTAQCTIRMGNGAKDSPFLIDSRDGLESMATDLDGYYKLTSDIDLASTDWTPIGNSSSGAFTGSLDGNGHTIDNMKIELTGNTETGLFGKLENGAIIKNLTLENVDVNVSNNGSYGTGAIAGEAYANGPGTEVIITGCTVEGSVRGMSYCGGVVGYTYTNEGTVTINDCAFSGTVTSRGYYAGGIVSYFDVESGDVAIQGCYNAGEITITGDGTGRHNLGGIVGSFANDGGIVTVKNCYNTGKIVAQTTNTHFVGGIVGQGGSANGGSFTMQNCYNTGEVGGTRFVGGIIGDAYAASGGSAEISGCVSLGHPVTASLEKASRINGMEHTTATMSNNLALSPMIVQIGSFAKDMSSTVGNDLEDGENVSIAAATNQDTYEDLGWDFDSVWKWSNDYMLPILQGLPESVQPTTRPAYWDAFMYAENTDGGALSVGDNVLALPNNQALNNFTANYDNSIFTAPESGEYYLTYNVTLTASVEFETFIYVNNWERNETKKSTTNGTSLYYSGSVNLGAGDTIELYVTAPSGATLSSSTLTLIMTGR